MMGLKKSQLVAVGIALVVVVLLAMVPRTPSTAKSEAAMAGRVSEDPNSGSTPHTEGPLSTDPKVAAILAELNAGGPPMQTVLKLRDLAEKEPNNVEAQFHLGAFSWETGQYDKAVARFKKVIELDPKGYPDAYAFLGRAYASFDSTELAIDALKKYEQLVTDTALINGAQRLIDELQSKQKN
ncbi:MAG TPA: tetratricopeptide repeat protein [Flavobacteriales bacterium]|nr:tetratricopeptide repeat protein [Flavobacteriales bacterium]